VTATRLLRPLALTLLALALLPATVMAKDSDKDGLPDSWEKGKAPGGLNLHKLGAKPKHRDVFVELSYSRKTGASDISCGALDDLVTAFKHGPLKNPDGKKGVTLHIDAGKKCGHSGFDLGGSGHFKVNGSGCANPSDIANSLAHKRLAVFHEGGVVADSELCSAEGIATTEDFIVKENGGGSFFSYVVMHELGHVFGLSHGPFDGFSVMSGGAYTYPTTNNESILDYTRYPIHSLDESALDEQTGFETGSAAGNAYLAKLYGPQYCLEGGNQVLVHQGPAHGGLDFDCSGAQFWVPPYSQYISPTPVSYDVNGDGVIGAIPAVQPEWPKLKFGNGRIGG
jgi:hypothetical protein